MSAKDESGELVAIDAALAELQSLRATIAARIAHLEARRETLAGGGNEPDSRELSGEVLGLLREKERTLRERVLLCLAAYKDAAKITTEDVAAAVDEDPKRVLMALQDLKAKSGFVGKPIRGTWTLSHPEGWAEARRILRERRELRDRAAYDEYRASVPKGSASLTFKSWAERRKGENS